MWYTRLGTVSDRFQQGKTATTFLDVSGRRKSATTHMLSRTKGDPRKKENFEENKRGVCNLLVQKVREAILTGRERFADGRHI